MCRRCVETQSKWRSSRKTGLLTGSALLTQCARTPGLGAHTPTRRDPFGFVSRVSGNTYRHLPLHPVTRLYHCLCLMYLNLCRYLSAYVCVRICVCVSVSPSLSIDSPSVDCGDLLDSLHVHAYLSLLSPTCPEAYCPYLLRSVSITQSDRRTQVSLSLNNATSSNYSSFSLYTRFTTPSRERTPSRQRSARTCDSDLLGIDQCVQQLAPRRCSQRVCMY